MCCEYFPSYQWCAHRYNLILSVYCSGCLKVYHFESRVLTFSFSQSWGSLNQPLLSPKHLVLFVTWMFSVKRIHDSTTSWIESGSLRVEYAFVSFLQIIGTDVGASGKVLDRELVMLISGSGLSVSGSIPTMVSWFK